MPESSSKRPQRVAVVGGGIAGLTSAYTLSKNSRETNFPIEISLFESAPTLGGKILTEQRDGFTIEGGPDSFLLQKPWAAELAQELGLEPELIGTNPNQKKLYVVNHGHLTPMPDGVMLIIPTRFMPFITSNLISWPGKIRMGMDFFIPRRKDDGDESVGNFIRRRLGTEALEKIAEPLMSGIHVSDPEKQSILGTFPRFRTIEKKHGSLIRGMLAQQAAARKTNHTSVSPTTPAWRRSVFVSLRGGMIQLVSALEKSLGDVEVHTGCAIDQIRPADDGGYLVTTANGEQLAYDSVILATPADHSAGLISNFATDLARELSSIRYVTTATVSVAYSVSDIRKTLSGVGFIIPRRENRKISACTISSIKFENRAPEGKVLLRCFIGGPGKEEQVEASDETIISNVRQELAALMGIQAEPLFARVFRWEKGNAQYDVGHLDRVKHIKELCARQPGLYLTGSAYDGIGIPDCVHQGRQVAEAVLTVLQQVPHTTE